MNIDKTDEENRSDGPYKEPSLLISFFGNVKTQFITAIVLIIISLLAHSAIEWNYTTEGETGVIHESIPLYFDYLPEIIRDLGIGFIVAAGIGLSVERAASTERSSILREFKSDARQMLDRVSEDTLSSYFRKNLPDGWFDFLKSQIDDHSCIRKNLDVEFSIREPTAIETDGFDKDLISKYLVFETTMRYSVNNLTSKTVPFPLETFTEFPYSDDLRSFTKVVELKIDGCILAPEELIKADSNWSDTHTHKHISTDVDIPRNGSIHVEVKVRTLKLKANDSVVWTSVHPTNGARFRAQAPKEFALFFAIVHSEYSGNMVRVSEDGTPIVMTIEQPILPYSVTEVRWAEKTIVGEKFLSDNGGNCEEPVKEQIVTTSQEAAQSNT